MEKSAKLLGTHPKQNTNHAEPCFLPMFMLMGLWGSRGGYGARAGYGGLGSGYGGRWAPRYGGFSRGFFGGPQGYGYESPNAMGSGFGAPGMGYGGMGYGPGAGFMGARRWPMIF